MEQQVAQALRPLELESPYITAGLVRYIAELRQWNARINLSAQNDIESIIAHIVDSLTIYPLLRAWGSGRRIVDIGSGNGFPAIPLALCAPTCRFYLVEANQKRYAFLSSAIIVAGIPNCTVIHARLRELAQRAEKYEAALVRALPQWDTQTVDHIAQLLCADGVLAVYARDGSRRSRRIATLLQRRFATVRTQGSPLLPDGRRAYIIAARAIQ